ncbi:flavin reductase family protein [Streptomyces sp. VRA16 Mangrove soil]|uniref:flavin reductase family protein n=1 Tax=Streptomyces sp. VRA16 Mangrove soil TaxID=2817434 RepID=UPI001A9D5D10|nr:flavin reductase family protein [Streptomyces sp. VRA16 Mangrove soil]MBO1332220.1 flavin reductase family protein [Streptomyces sp. VRA16 Mangrove soil]
MSTTDEPDTATARTAAPAVRLLEPARADLVRSVLRRHAKGVAVVTVGGERPVGFCVTSLASLSLEPPLMSFTVGLRSASWGAVRDATWVMVQLLAEGQAEVARVFAGPGASRFGPATRWHPDPLGLPALEGVLARFVLTPVSFRPVGDHALVIGLVVRAARVTDAGPLVHHDGEFIGLPVTMSGPH